MKKKSFKDITMGITSLGKRGQVVIPANIRKKLKIKSKEKFMVLLTHSETVIFVPVRRFKKMIYQLDKKISEFKKLAK